MAVELAAAYISIVPTTLGFKKALEREFAGIDGIIAKAGEKSGVLFTHNFSNQTKTLAGVLAKHMQIVSTTSAQTYGLQSGLNYANGFKRASARMMFDHDDNLEAMNTLSSAFGNESGTRYGGGFVKSAGPGVKRGVKSGLEEGAGAAEGAGRETGNRFAEGFKATASVIGHGVGSILKTGVKIAGAAAGGAIAAGGIGIATAAAMEQSEIAFTTMLGSGEKAKAFLADLSKFAAKTPFDLPGLQESASSLVSAGIDANKVIPIMTSLGNATSGMGTGAEGVKRATVALQQMNAAGKISGEDLNQLRDAGIPVFDLLTAATGKTTAEIADMAAKGKLGREELEQLMTALETGKGLEKFNGLMEKQAGSLTGLWSTAKDTFQVGMAEAVTPIIPLLKDGLGGATAFLTDTVMPKAKDAFAAVAAGIVVFRDAWVRNDGDVKSSGFSGFMERAAFVIRGLVDWLGRLDFSSVSNFFQSVGGSAQTSKVLDSIGESFGILWTAVQEFSRQSPDFLGAGLTILGQGLKFLADNIDTIIKWMPAIVAAFVAWKVAQMGIRAAQAISIPIQVALNITRIAAALAERSAANATRAATAATTQQTAANQAGLFTRLRQAAATVAHGIATTATAVATKAAAAGQWLLNAALTANPIAIVVIAIAALVAGLVWFFTQTELGQQIIQNVWGAIQSFIGDTVKWFQDFVLPTIEKVLAGAGDAFNWLWESVVKPVFGFISAAISGAWTILTLIFEGFVFLLRDVVGPAFRWLYETVVKPIFDKIGDVVKTVWETVIKPVFDTLGTFISETLPKAFEDGLAFIKKAWDGLNEIVKAPIRFVIQSVINDGLISSFNTVGGFFGMDPIPPVGLPAGFSAGGWTGPGSKYQPAGLVHADEHVIRKESRQRMERTAPGLLDHINRFGSLAGYAGGGRVSPLDRLVVTQGYNRVHKGIDFGVPVGTPVYATQTGVVTHAGPGARAPGVWGGNEVHILGSGIETWFAHLSRIMVGLGESVRAGQQVALSGNTGISSGPHLHFGVFAGGWPNDLDPTAYLSGASIPAGGGDGGGGGGGFVPFNPIAGIIDGLVQKFKEAFPGGGHFIDLVGGVGKKILTGAADFVAGLFGGSRDKSGGTGAATLFDGGGWLERTGRPQLVEHRRRRPDAVLTHSQWENMRRIADGTAVAQQGTLVTFNGPVYGNPEHIVDEMDARKRRAAALTNLSAITIGA